MAIKSPKISIITDDNEEVSDVTAKIDREDETDKDSAFIVIISQDDSSQISEISMNQQMAQDLVNVLSDFLLFAHAANKTKK